MKGGKVKIRHHCMLSLTAILSLCPVKALTDKTEEEQVIDLVYSEQFGASERERLEKLGKQSVLIPTMLLERKPTEWPYEFRLRIIGMLAGQFKRHQEELSTAERQRALAAMVSAARSLQETKWPMNQALLLLRGIDAEIVRNLALEFKNNPDKHVRGAAEKLLDSVHKPTDALHPPSPSLPKPAPSEPVSTKTTDQPSTPTPWAILAAVSVGAASLVWFALRKWK